MLNPYRLRLLDALERLGTVRAVAAELNMSPSSVSQQLSVLEAETRTQLFERVGRRLTLTPAGVMLAARARDILDQMEEVVAELADLQSEAAGHIRVASFASAVVPILVEAAKSLAQEHPRLQVELLEIEPHESIPALQRGSCDVIVTVDLEDGSAPIDPGIRTIPLAADPLMLVLPQRHPLTDRRTVTFSDLATERWALDLPGTYLGELVPRLCRSAGFEPAVAGRFASYSVLLGHVAAGLSIAVLPKLAVDRRYGVATRRVEGLGDRKVIAAVRRGTGRRAAVSAVLSSLRSPAMIAT